MYGREVPEVLTTQASIGVVEPGSPADQAGIRKGDRISELDGKQKPNWQDVEAQVALSTGKSLPIVLDRNGESISTTVTPVKKGPSDRGYVGMGPYLPVVVASVWPEQRAELLPGDEVTVVNGVDLTAKASSLPFRNRISPSSSIDMERPCISRSRQL
jgi:regulator of sigma E protease